jgi:CRP-like cAMP-binding protein
LDETIVPLFLEYPSQLAPSGFLEYNTNYTMVDNKERVVTDLTHCPLFEDVNPDDIKKLLDHRGVLRKSVHKHAIVAFRGDVCESLMIVLSGSLAAEFRDYRGKVLKVETLRRGEVVASAILFSPDNLLPVNLSAAEECSLLEIPRSVVCIFLRQNEAFMYNFLTDMGTKLTFLADKLYLNQFSTIKQKIASYLLDQADKQGNESVEVKITKEVLAEMFGVARPSLSRSFSNMQEEGIIAQEGTMIHILDQDRLEQIIEEE